MRVKDGAALRQRRERRGLTQRELAFLARPCSQTTIYLLEKEKITAVNAQLALRIARRLEVAVEELFEDPPDARGAARVQAVTGAPAPTG
jgi:DNA-binding XRE family transcriptional regulator